MIFNKISLNDNDIKILWGLLRKYHPLTYRDDIIHIGYRGHQFEIKVEDGIIRSCKDYLEFLEDPEYVRKGGVV